MALYYKDKEITSIYHKGREISALYNRTTLIWEAVRSCFGKGFWKNELSWRNDDGWKNK
jgi:hypothetical protein